MATVEVQGPAAVAEAAALAEAERQWHAKEAAQFEVGNAPVRHTPARTSQAKAASAIRAVLAKRDSVSSIAPSSAMASTLATERQPKAVSAIRAALARRDSSPAAMHSTRVPYTPATTTPAIKNGVGNDGWLSALCRCLETFMDDPQSFEDRRGAGGIGAHATPQPTAKRLSQAGFDAEGDLEVDLEIPFTLTTTPATAPPYPSSEYERTAGGPASEKATVEAEAAYCMQEGHAANARGQFEEAWRWFNRSHELAPRPAARVSAANMALKLGDAEHAMSEYLDVMEEGSLAGGREMLQRKLREASKSLVSSDHARRTMRLAVDTPTRRASTPAL